MRSMWFGALVVLLTFAGAATASAPPGNWTLLNSWSVTLTSEGETIPVGIGRGSFDRLYLTVANNALNITTLKVTYASGMEEDVPVGATIAKGGNTAVLPLKGTDRRISMIKVNYQKIATGVPAVVSLYGSQG